MRLLNKNTARRAAAAAALLTMTAAMSVGAFAADAEDATVAGYLPPQSSEVMVQGDIALHSDVPVGEVDPNYGGYASPVENPIQGNVMMISDETPLPSDTPVEKSEARYTVKGLLGKQVLYTARQEGRVLTLDGNVMLTERDEFIYDEMITHVPMSVHRNAKDILVIGAGDGGVVRELTRYDRVERIDLVEMDPQVIEACRAYLPSNACRMDDRRVHIYLSLIHI